MNDNDLLDWFAGLASQALISAGMLDIMSYEEISERSYKQADAMLSEREKRIKRAAK